MVDHPDENEQDDCAQNDDNGSHSSHNSKNNIYDDESDDDSMLLPMGLTQGSTAASRHCSIITTEPVPVVEDAIMECLAAAVESHDQIDTELACWSSPTVSFSGRAAADPHFVLDEWQPRSLSTLPAWMMQRMDTDDDPPTKRRPG